MGIYRGPLPSTPKNLTKIAYFDQVRFAKSCEKLKLEDLGYSCEELESQKILTIDTIAFDNYIAVIKNKDDGDYLLKVSGETKKLTEKKGLKKCKEAGNTKCYVHFSGPKPLY